MVKKVYKKEEDKAADCFDFIGLADSIHKNLGDEEWARKLYYAAFFKTVSQQVPVGGGELFDLAESIRNNLGDKELAKEVYEEAKFR